jgi:phosphoserine phosphatase
MTTVSLIMLTGCKRAALLSWREGAAKSQLIELVESTTNKKSADYLPAEQRVAVFDLDGTLYSESYPVFFCFALYAHRVLNDPSYKATEEETAVAKEALATGKTPPLSDKDWVSTVFAGMKREELREYVEKFIEEDQPGYTGLKRRDAFFKPMREVVEYLVANEFKVFVVSGTDREITRGLAAVIGVPAYQVIGTDNVLVFSKQKDETYMQHIWDREEEVIQSEKRKDINLQMKKVESIINEIGIRPVIAFGNAMTDASMLNYAAFRKGGRAFVLIPDDMEREYGNEAEAEKLRAACKTYGWVPVSMKDDWLTIYGIEVKKQK